MMHTATSFTEGIRNVGSFKKYFIDFLPTNQSSKKLLDRNVRYKRLCEKRKPGNTVRAQIAFLVSADPSFNKFLRNFKPKDLMSIFFSQR